MPEQFSLPLRVVAGRIAMIEQGSDQEVADRVHVLCRTPPGWLDSHPGFGLADQRFRKGGADLAHIDAQVSTWVPDWAGVLDHDASMLNEGFDYIGVKVAA